MDGINIDDLTIGQYLRLTQENQTPSMVKKVDDMTIAEYIEYEERMKRQYSRNSGSYFPTYSGHCTSNNNTTLEFPCNTYFNPIPPNTKFNYDYEDMELDKEVGYTTDEESVMSEHKAIDPAHAVNTQSFEEELSSEEDIDEWLKAEMEKHMSKQNEKNKEDALIAIIKSIREECRDVYKNKQISASKGTDLKNLLRPWKTLSIMTALQFEHDTRNYDTIDLQNEIARQINPLLDKGGLTKRWHICKPVQVFYDDRSDKDCGMWPTCDPDSSLCNGYKEVFIKCEQGMLIQWRIDDITRERRYYEWVAQNYEFDSNRTPSTTTVFDKCPYKTNYPTPIPLDEWDTRCHITYTGSTSNQNIPNNDHTPFLLEHSEIGEKANISESPKLRPFRPRPCDYPFDEWLKVKIWHTNIYDSDREIVFNEWILDSFDVEGEYAKEIGNPYSRKFDEYKQVFDNEVEHLSNEYTLRIGKKGYVLDDV
ncbi:hypothetical protein Tco_1446659 [Tanacetum coccineum]